MKRNRFFILLLFFFISGATAREYNFIYPEDAVLDFFKYDTTVALDLTTEFSGSILSYYKMKVQFSSIHDERIDARLWIPRDANEEKEYPCVLWLHGYGGNKSLDDGAFMILSPMLGYAIMSLDAQYHGDRRVTGKAMYSLDLVQDRYAIAQTVVDYRRAIDALEQIPGIDSERIGVLGGSMGGMMGGLLAGVDSRVKATVLVVGGGHWSEMMRASDHKTAPALRAYLKGHYRMVDRFLEPVDPLRLIHRVHHLQMHNGTADMTVPYATSVELFERAAEPKEFYSYEGLTHVSLFEDIEAAQEIIVRSIDWFKLHLGTETR